MTELLEKKLSETNWASSSPIISEGFSDEEMVIFNRILNEITNPNEDQFFYGLQEELRFYEKERSQFLTHTRKKFKNV